MGGGGMGGGWYCLEKGIEKNLRQEDREKYTGSTGIINAWVGRRGDRESKRSHGKSIEMEKKSRKRRKEGCSWKVREGRPQERLSGIKTLAAYSFSVKNRFGPGRRGTTALLKKKEKEEFSPESSGAALIRTDGSEKIQQGQKGPQRTGKGWVVSWSSSALEEKNLVIL